MKAKLMAVLLAFAALSLLAGCNTIQGAGKDIQKAGQAVEKAAKRAKKG